MADFTGQNIQDTYQRVVQVDGNQLQDGTGSNLPISFNGDDVIIPGALRANSYIVSQSTTIATSGSTIFGNSYDDTHTFSGSVNIGDKVNTDYDDITPALFVRQDAVDRSQIANGFGGSIDLLVQRGSNANGARTGRIASRLTTGAQTISDYYALDFNLRSNDTQIDLMTLHTSNTNTSGRVGILDTTPSYTLDVNGDFRAVGDINAGGNIVGDGATTISGINTITAASISSSGAIIGNRLQTDDYIIGDTSVATGLSVFGYIETTGTTGHITASGNISASGHLMTNQSLYVNGKIYSDGDQIIYYDDDSTLNLSGTGGIQLGTSALQHVTSSGNISSSGLIQATNGFYAGASVRLVETAPDAASIQKNDGSSLTTLQLKADQITGQSGFVINANNLLINHITASGNISASGTIVGSNLSGTNTGDQDLSGYVLNAITASLLVRNSETGSFLTSIPTGTVSSSLQLPTGILSSSLQLPTGIFSASAGGDLLLPHNGEVGYDSNNHILFGSTQVAIDATIFNINASNRVNFHDSNVGIRMSNINTTAPEALTVEGNISSSGTITANKFVGAPIHIVAHSWYFSEPAGTLANFQAGSTTYGWSDRNWNQELTKASVETGTWNSNGDSNLGVAVTQDIKNIKLIGTLKPTDATDQGTLSYYVYKMLAIQTAGSDTTNPVFICSGSSPTVGNQFQTIYITGSAAGGHGGFNPDVGAVAGDRIIVFSSVSNTFASTKNLKGTYTVTAEIA
jgi:hypothetical protein